jgi:adenylate cyclase
MSAPGLKSPSSLDPRYFVTAEVITRPPDERPRHDSIRGIAKWLAGPARQIPSGGHAFDEFAWRLLAAGLPLLRVTLHAGTLHPQYMGTNFVWWRTTGQTKQTMVAHEVGDQLAYEENPVLRTGIGGETLRRRLDVPDHEFDFAILHDLKAAGGTDYFALPVPSAYGRSYTVTYVTDRPGGFSQGEIADLTRVSQRLAPISDMYSQREIARNLLKAYLGPKTGPRVLAGQPSR